MPTPDPLLVTLTVPQFHQLLDAKLQPLLDALRRAQTAPEPEYLTTQQALDLLHLSKPTLHKLRGEGRITAYSSSDKRVLYRRSELLAYLQAAPRNSISPAPDQRPTGGARSTLPRGRGRRTAG
ncbi:helix-turn-helix domain-containing protein [Hymenobacter gummosus]|nr:helix-turn-helix domain-containing protein [Hymenobacter gummosus]